MLYVNAYLVSRVRGGSEEGGWYYDTGKPLASVPIVDVIRKPGASYYITRNGDSASIHDAACTICDGTGLTGEPDRDGYRDRCDACGERPADLAQVAKAMDRLSVDLKDEPGRQQEIRVCLERHFAQPFPENRPVYE